ncbi:unnamed protein product [Ceutorhynchus assimilis]|uniref:Uncharacterized protein n=1 Tax=Ceutorhynchus assimilis TaxID=467358 RepID=A0A9P0DKT0_9CUCU|nr:unnamed protein product [Ceutorhynchus assimilis]
MENNKWTVIHRKPIFKGPPVLCAWPYPSVAQLVKNELEKFAKEQQLALSNDNDETTASNQPELPQSNSEASQSNTETSQSNPQQTETNSQAQPPQPKPQPSQSIHKLSNSQQTQCTNPQPPQSNLLFPESNHSLPPSTSTHFFHFLRLMQMFPETHPATLHTVLTMSRNKFLVAIDKLLYAQRSRNDMMSKTIRPNVSVIRERQANSFSTRSHSNRGRPPKTQKYEPCSSSVSNNHLTDVLGSKTKYLVPTSTFKNQKLSINSNDNPNQKRPCVQIEDNDILEMYYDPSLDEETFEDLIENEDPSLNDESFKGFIENEDVLMNDNEEPEPNVIVVENSEDECK